MTLYRSEIRAATVALLKDATPAGGRVWPTRIMPLRKPSYPAILVYTLDEDMRGNGHPPPQFDHELILQIQVRTQPTGDDGEGFPDDFEDEVDGICEAVLNRLLTNPEWVGRFDQIRSVNTRVGFDARGERPLVGALITITGTYGSIWEPVIPDTFASTSIGIDCIDPSDPNLASPGPDGRPEAGAIITIPTT
jgi:hypothetical protein